MYPVARLTPFQERLAVVPGLGHEADIEDGLVGGGVLVGIGDGAQKVLRLAK